jgi:hypothetical protein
LLLILLLKELEILKARVLMLKLRSCIIYSLFPALQENRAISGEKRNLQRRAAVTDVSRESSLGGGRTSYLDTSIG